jgi:hypothetical protein
MDRHEDMKRGVRKNTMSQPAASRRNARLHSILPEHACRVRVSEYAQGLLPIRKTREPHSHHLLTCRGSIEGKGYRPSRASPGRLLVHGFSEEGTDGNMTNLSDMQTCQHRRHRNEAQEPAEAKGHQCLRIKHDFSLTCRRLKS